MADRFELWLRKATPGSNYVYHSGSELSRGNGGIHFTSQVYSAREAYERGEVDLVLRRTSAGRGKFNIGSTFDWVAIKRSVVKIPEKAFSVDGEPVHWRERPAALLKAA